MNPEAIIIFDNGGGVTLQLGDYAHHYGSGTDAAEDYLEYQDTRDTSGWDGHEDGGRVTGPIDRRD